MGLVGAVLTALAQPAPLTLMKPEEFVARPARWLQAISRYRATISAAPNFAYELAVERVGDDELQGVDLSSWLIALDGAEPVAASTLTRFYERFRAFGFRREALTPVYGLAEASLAVTFSRPDRPFTSRRFDGAALVGKEEAIESVDGIELVEPGERPCPESMSKSATSAARRYRKGEWAAFGYGDRRSRAKAWTPGGISTPETAGSSGVESSTSAVGAATS